MHEINRHSIQAIAPNDHFQPNAEANHKRPLYSTNINAVNLIKKTVTHNGPYSHHKFDNTCFLSGIKKYSKKLSLAPVIQKVCSLLPEGVKTRHVVRDLWVEPLWRVNHWE